MTTRRSLIFVTLALALVAPTAAHADKKPVRTTPKIYILLTDGATNKTVSPSIQTSFSPPKGTTTKTACDGKVTVSAPIGKKTVKGKKKTAKGKKKTVYATKKSALKTRLGVCTATSFLALPASFYGKTVKFTSSFPGNDVVKKFKKSSTFTVVTPPPPAPPFVPTAGPWTISQVPGGLNSQVWTFTMGANGAVQSIKRLSLLSVQCGIHTVQLSPSPEKAAFDTPFAISKTDVTATDHFIDTMTGGATSDALSTFTLHFDSAGHATGTFQLTGSLVDQTGVGDSTQIYSGCDTGPININLKPGTPA